jgi:hypothetical protein
MSYVSPVYIDEFKIYDIYHNDTNELIIITPYLPNSYTITLLLGEDTKTFNLHRCPHNHTDIYTLNIEYMTNIKIMIGNCIIDTIVNKYPSFQGEIIFSTICKDEDDFIIPWIQYHVRLGISRFIIYDNSLKRTLATLLEDYINKGIVLLISWPYEYISSISGISGQTTQQNHSIYAFRNSKYIGLFDIDEYVNTLGVLDIHYFFEQLIRREKIDVNSISSFRLLNKYFYNPLDLPVHNSEFLRIFNCDTIKTSGCYKHFVIPKNVITFSVHMVTSGKESYNVNETYIYFNHYIYLNKTDRGRNQTSLMDDTILLNLGDSK